MYYRSGRLREENAGAGQFGAVRIWLRPYLNWQKLPALPMILRLLLVTLPLYVLDQATKWLVLQNIPVFSPIEVIPGFFNLVLTYNTGMAFGLMKDSNGFFIGLSFVAIGVLAAMMWRRVFSGPVQHAAFLILLAGILGNLTDRILHGHVIDFLEFYIVSGERPLVWPAFNVADSCICIAAALFVLTSFADGSKTKARGPAAGVDDAAS